MYFTYEGDVYEAIIGHGAEIKFYNIGMAKSLSKSRKHNRLYILERRDTEPGKYILEWGQD